MLQKQCWSSGVKDVAKVVLQRTLLQKITNAYVVVITWFFSSNVEDDNELGANVEDDNELGGSWLIVIS